MMLKAKQNKKHVFLKDTTNLGRVEECLRYYWSTVRKLTYRNYIRIFLQEKLIKNQLIKKISEIIFAAKTVNLLNQAKSFPKAKAENERTD